MAGRIRRGALAAGAAFVAALTLLMLQPAPAAVAPVSFTKTVLAGATSSQATTLQFGPDGRLYVGQQDGLIKAYTIVRHGPGSYEAVRSETIGALLGLPNH